MFQTGSLLTANSAAVRTFATARSIDPAYGAVHLRERFQLSAGI